MTELFVPEDPNDRRLVHGLAEDRPMWALNRAGVLEAADVHVAERVSRLVGEEDDAARLALALAVRAVRAGSVCVDLAEVAAVEPDLPWPDPGVWLARVADGPLVTSSVLRVEGDLLYLDRYWREEGQVCADLLAREAQSPPAVDPELLVTGGRRIFPEGYDEQRAAAIAAAGQWTTVLTGGPGTGKTTAVAGLLALLAEQAGPNIPPRVALTAPTGKAAARLQQAVAEAASALPRQDRERVGTPTASTLHRLLGSRPDSRTRFRHHRGNRLAHDVVVVDETSMVSLTMMARLLEAVRPDARLVLVGDPDQLASVEAGAVLADLVVALGERNATTVAALRTSHRFGARIGELAAAVRKGDADQTWTELAAGGEEVSLVDGESAAGLDAVRRVVLGTALEMTAAAEAGDPAAALAALDRHRLLCAHREGPFGAEHWNRLVERWLGEALGAPVGRSWGREWYAGRPVLVSANDYGLGLYNGDTGVTVRDGDDLRVHFSRGVGVRSLAPSRLADVVTLHAMTVHKSQGSQAVEVTVLLPPEDSRLLTRELFYTAVTRAQQRVRVVATEESVRAAVTRRARRASGLRQRMRRTDPAG